MFVVVCMIAATCASLLPICVQLGIFSKHATFGLGIAW